MLAKFTYGLAAILMAALLSLTPSARASELFDDREDLLLELILFDRFNDPFDRFEERFDRFDQFDRFERFDKDRFDRFERFDRPGLGFGRIGPPGRIGPQGRARGFDR